MEAFEITPLPGRVLFGRGTLARIADEVRRLGCSRAFVLSDRHHREGAAARVMQLLGDGAVGLSTDAVMHTPVEVTERVLQHVRAARPDCLVSLGGGSTTGLSKALALRTDLPQIAIPTTYAGSEATPILGQTEQGQKTTLRSPKGHSSPRRRLQRSAAPLALQRVAQALGTGQAGAGLFDLASSLGAPTSLKSIGMSESDLDKAAEIATAVPYWNPRPVGRDAIRALLDDAYHGRRPRN